MLRLLIDENFSHRILRGLCSRLPQLDFVLVSQVGLARLEDTVLLRWAADNNRVIVTRDVKTMVPFAKQLVNRGEPMAGVIVVPETMSIGRSIEELAVVVVCRSQEELRDFVQYLPL